jgi:hypothetical protein
MVADPTAAADLLADSAEGAPQVASGVGVLQVEAEAIYPVAEAMLPAAEAMLPAAVAGIPLAVDTAVATKVTLISSRQQAPSFGTAFFGCDIPLTIRSALR